MSNAEFIFNQAVNILAGIHRVRAADVFHHQIFVSQECAHCSHIIAILSSGLLWALTKHPYFMRQDSQIEKLRCAICIVYRNSVSSVRYIEGIT